MYDRYEKQKIVDAFFKTEMGDGIFALFFYRPLAYLIFKKIIRKPVNPNKITIITLIFYTSAALLLFIYPIEPFSVILQNKVYGIDLWFLLFLIAFNMAPIFDCMDGAIARLFNKTSAKGRLLDSFVDSFGFAMIFAALLKRFVSYTFYIAVIFFVYFAYSNIALSYMLEKARKDPQAKAVILYVNSPGGSAAASEALYNAVKKLSKEKVVVAYIAEYGTSGAYMAVLPSDHIVAAESSLVGSIGVYTMIVNYKGLLDKLGVQVYTFKSGDLKDVGSPFRNMTEEDAEVFKEIISDLFEIFKARVKKHRTIEDEEVFTGRPFTASKALQLGLIDEIGDFDTAVEAARKLAGLREDVPVKELKPRTPSLFEALLGASVQGRVKLLPSYEILAMWPPPTVYIEP